MTHASTERAILRLTPKIRGWTRLVLLAWLTAACMTWNPRPLDTPNAETTRLKGRVRVILRNGPSFLEMKDVQVSADSVIGFRDSRAIERLAIPRSQVVSIERRAFNPARTAILLLTLAVGAVVAFYVAFCLAVCNDPNF